MVIALISDRVDREYGATQEEDESPSTWFLWPTLVLDKSPGISRVSRCFDTTMEQG